MWFLPFPASDCELPLSFRPCFYVQVGRQCDIIQRDVFLWIVQLLYDFHKYSICTDITI